jgi:hypothetical protein
MKVICTRPGLYLTLDKIYEVENINTTDNTIYYRIIDDDGESREFFKNRFTVVENTFDEFKDALKKGDSLVLDFESKQIIMKFDCVKIILNSDGVWTWEKIE